MSNITILTCDEAGVSPSQSALDTLAASIEGSLAFPGSADYEEARTVWNAMIDRKPALVVRCKTAGDVQKAVQFARDLNLLVAVRGGGHNIAGNAVCDGGLLIDLSMMKGIKVDPDARTAQVEPGVTLGELDAATQAHGLATPVGINSTTGIAGLTLGGGFGWISRKHGMTIDNLLSARIVTADGEMRTVSEAENPDLFWGIRGGGGNFGIVTSFEFRLHPIGPEILAGLIVHPFADAKEVFRFYREFCKTAPDDITVWAVARKAPPLPFLPEEWHGKEVLVLAVAAIGDRAQAEKTLEPLRAFGNPIADVIGPTPFVGWQTAFDPLLTPGMRNYWKSHDFLGLEDGFIDVLIEAIHDLPSPHCEVFIGQMGGMTNRVSPSATAYPHRDAEFIMNVHGRWETAAEDERCIAWCRKLFDSATPFATGGVYVNFMTEEEAGRVSKAYGPALERLTELKRRYDPTNLFRMNQNIRPI